MNLWWLGSVTTTIFAAVLTGRVWLIWLAALYGATILALFFAGQAP